MRAGDRAAAVLFTIGHALTARTDRATLVKRGREPDREIKRKEKRTEHLESNRVKTSGVYDSGSLTTEVADIRKF